MAATWTITKVWADTPEEAAEFQANRFKGVQDAAAAAELDFMQKSFKTPAGSSLELQRRLHKDCQEDPRIIWCSLSGPRGTYHIIKGSVR